MARVTCAISGLRFSTDYFESLSLAHTAGFIHPIFAANHKQLHQLYSQHCKGELQQRDSYLLFLAFLHSSDKITWRCPAMLEPTSLGCRQLVENNIAQLVSVLAKTDYIQHPSFSQPDFTVTVDNSDLRQIPNYIRAWKENISDFYIGRASDKERDALVKVENKLTYLILSGEDPEKFSHVIANWANKAGGFPSDKSELWKKTIQSCFSITKMFKTPLPLLKEIKEFCECNIEAGSIHFHTLSHVLKEGIRRHVDYLGGSSLALGYTLLDPTTTSNSLGNTARREQEIKGEAELQVITASAPSSYPKREDYSSSLAFLKAKLAFRVASIQVVQTVTVVKDKTDLSYDYKTTGKSKDESN